MMGPPLDKPHDDDDDDVMASVPHHNITITGRIVAVAVARQQVCKRRYMLGSVLDLTGNAR